jgi:GNAT superfamily N-acetyltransferase
VDFDACPDVRLAEPEDYEPVIELMRVACKEDAQHEMDEDKVRAMVLRHYNKQGVMLAVIGEVGKPVGYCLSLLDPVWYSNEWQLLELSLFVHPDHRKSNFAKQLMQFMKSASEGLKLDLTIGVFSNERTEAKIRLYQRQFPQAGAFFCFRPSANA